MVDIEIRITPKQLALLERAAKDRGMTLNEFANHIIRNNYLVKTGIKTQLGVKGLT